MSVDLIAAEAGVSKVTVYNHFGSKEALFIGVVKDSLDAPLGGTLADAIARLADSDDLRESLITAARAWVAGIRTNPEILALRNVVARELHRFPELGEGWHDAGPERHHPAVAEHSGNWSHRAGSTSPTSRWPCSSLLLLVFP